LLSKVLNINKLKFNPIFFSVTDHQTPRDRFIQVVKWYLSAFHAGRKSAVPKKPYNPILGEIFQCYYDMGASSSNVSRKFNNSNSSLVSFSIDKYIKRRSCSMGK
jgi:hypothetical protein